MFTAVVSFTLQQCENHWTSLDNVCKMFISMITTISDKSIARRFSHAVQQQLSQLGHDRAKFKCQRYWQVLQTLSKGPCKGQSCQRSGGGKALQELRRMRELCDAAAVCGRVHRQWNWRNIRAPLGFWTPLKHPGNGFLLVSRSAPWLSRQPDAEGAEQHFEKVPNFWVWKGDQSTQAPVLQPHGEVMLKKTNASNAHLPSFSHLFSVFRNNPNIQTLLSIRIDHSSLAVYLNCGTNYSKGSQSLHTSWFLTLEECKKHDAPPKQWNTANGFSIREQVMVCQSRG